MFQVYRAPAAGIEKNAKQSFGFGSRSGDFYRILLPFPGIDAQIPSVHDVVLCINKFNAYGLRSSVDRSGPNRKAVGGTFFEAYTSEAFIFESGMLVTMSGGRQTHVMRIAFKGSINASQLHFAKGFPTHKVLRKFKGTVFYQFGIQAPVCSKVDVFEENAVHVGVNIGNRLVGLHFPLYKIILCLQRR